MPYAWRAIKAHQNYTYYLAAMEFGEIDRLVVLPKDGDDDVADFLLPEDEGSPEMQRELNLPRVKKALVPYLLEAPDAFFSALTLFIVPRDLTDLTEGKDYKFVPQELGSDEGRLEIHSGCVLFPGDGQHRAAAIKLALRKKPSIASKKIPVVLIPYTDQDTVRQVFSDLNLNAKPVNKTIGIAFDSRMLYTQVSKITAESVELFKGKVNRRTNSLPGKAPYVITLNTIAEVNKLLMQALFWPDKPTKDIELIREDNEAEVAEVAERLLPLWDLFIEEVSPWHSVTMNQLAPWQAREQSVSAHGIGWQAIGHVANVIIRAYPKTWEDELRTLLASVDWNRGHPGWQGTAVLGNRVNNTSSSVRAAAGYILECGHIEHELAQPYYQALANERGNHNPENVTIA